MTAAEVDAGTDQHLMRDGRPTSLVREQAAHGRKVASGAVPSDRDPSRVAAESATVHRSPLDGRIAVFEASGKAVLWGEAIVDVADDVTRSIRETPADVLDRIDASPHPARPW
jgi:hypothetical protein